ncbi:MAG: hypothetical protein H6973_04385 [Gammaproteobacteria bacterium]|nr:hypothetical protein [Gammaproteobacteria bacterium]
MPFPSISPARASTIYWPPSRNWPVNAYGAGWKTRPPWAIMCNDHHPQPCTRLKRPWATSSRAAMNALRR